MILSQVIQILVIFHKSPLKFGLTMKIGHFRDIRRVISWHQGELFEFRKKRQLPLIKPYHICSNWKIDQKKLGPPPIALMAKKANLHPRGRRKFWVQLRPNEKL